MGSRFPSRSRRACVEPCGQRASARGRGSRIGSSSSSSSRRSIWFSWGVLILGACDLGDLVSRTQGQGLKFYSLGHGEVLGIAFRV